MALPRQKSRKGLGDAIREKVAEQGTTMERASVALGQTNNALSRWNTGIEPKAEYYELLMDFLGVSLEELGALIVVDQLRRYGLPEP